MKGLVQMHIMILVMCDSRLCQANWVNNMAVEAYMYPHGYNLSLVAL